MTSIAQKHLGLFGMLGSKTIYRAEHPDNLIIFNARVFTANSFLWKGDLDISISYQNLKDLSTELEETIYVFYESDAFSIDRNPNLEKAAVIVESQNLNVSEDILEFYKMEDGQPIRIPPIPYKPKKSSEKKSDYVEMAIPDLKALKVTAKQDGWDQFQSMFIDMYGKTLAEKIYKNFYLSAKAYKKINSITRRCLKRKYPYLHDAKIQQEVEWSSFLMSPKSFGPDLDPKWVKPEYGYIKKIDLIKK